MGWLAKYGLWIVLGVAVVMVAGYGVYRAYRWFRLDSMRVEVPWFEVEVQLDDTAERVLRERGETIIVSAHFDGSPKRRTGYELGNIGELYLGGKEIELDGPGVARFEGITVSKGRVVALKDPDYRVHISVVSGRRTHKNNLLDTDSAWVPISEVQHKRHVITGKLLREPDGKGEE